MKGEAFEVFDTTKNGELCHSHIYGSKVLVSVDNYKEGSFIERNLKGDLSCKMHFLMSFIHEYVCRGTHAASENKTLSLFLRTQIF